MPPIDAVEPLEDTDSAVEESPFDDESPIPPIEDLYDAVDYSDDRLQRLRNLRAQALIEYGGRYWYEDDKKQRTLNLVQRGIKVLIAHLAARSPRFEVSTDRMVLRGEARKISKQLDMRAEQGGAARFQRLAMFEAFISGVCTVRVSEKSSAEAVRNADRFVFRGQTCRRIVSFDDWIFDPGARSHEEALFEGERYRMRKSEALRACKQGIFGYDATVEDGETPPIADVATPEEAYDLVSRAAVLDDGRTDRRQDKAEDITGARVTDEQKHGLVEIIELIDLAIYVDAHTCVLVTMLADRNASPMKFLRAEIWDGPARGPYEHLEFDPVPDNPIGPSIVSSMREQADAANTVIGKMMNQIERTRRVLVYKKGRSKDALKITKTQDGGTVGIDGDLADIKDIDLGGVSPQLAPFAQMLVGFWNTQGSYDILGGTQGGPARTAQEDSRLGAAANILVESLADMGDDFQTRLIRHEAWYFLHDPFINTTMTIRNPMGYEIEVVYDAQQRMGDFEDYTFKLKPRSMQRIDPAVRNAQIVQLLDIILKAAQVEAATGIVDTAAITRIAGRRFDEDELDEIIRDPIFRQQLDQLYAGMPMPTRGQPIGPGGGGMQQGGMQQPSPGGMRQGIQQSAYAPMFAGAA